MARDDMFSWLSEGKKPKEDVAPSRSAPLDARDEPIDDASTFVPEGVETPDKPQELKSAEDVSEIISEWVTSIPNNSACPTAPLDEIELDDQPSDPHNNHLNPQQLVPEELVPKETEQEEPEQEELVPKEPEQQDDIPDEPPGEPLSSSAEDVDLAETEPGNGHGEPQVAFDDKIEDEIEDLAPPPIEPSSAQIEQIEQAHDSDDQNIINEPPLSAHEKQRFFELSTKARREPKPIVGMAALEVTPTHLRRARVVAVKAGGRRVLAQILNTNTVHVYTVHPDKTYRLEGKLSKSAPRLILDVDI